MQPTRKLWLIAAVLASLTVSVVLQSSCSTEPSGDSYYPDDGCSGSSPDDGGPGPQDQTQAIIDMYASGTIEAAYQVAIHADPQAGQFWELSGDYQGSEFTTRWQVASRGETTAVVEYRSKLTSTYTRQDYVVAYQIDLTVQPEQPNVIGVWIGKPDETPRVIRLATPKPQPESTLETQSEPFSGLELAGKTWSGTLQTTRGDGWKYRAWVADGGYFDRVVKYEYDGYDPKLTALGDDARPLLKLAVLPMAAGAPAQAPLQLSFRSLRVVGFSRGDDGKGTRLLLRFDAEDAQGQPISGINSAEVSCTQSGRALPGAEIKPAHEAERACPVVVLVCPGARGTEIKPALRALESRLTEAGSTVALHRCGASLTKLASVDELPDNWPAESDTAIYACLTELLRQFPQAVVVLFAACADRAPASRQLATLKETLRSGGHVVHTVGYANIGAESDQQGIVGTDALEQLATNGTYEFADSPLALETRFEDIAVRINATHAFSVQTSAQKGTYDFQLKLTRGLASATSIELQINLDTQTATRAAGK